MGARKVRRMIKRRINQMNRERAIEKLGFIIDYQIFNDKLDDSKCDCISKHTQELIDAWEYVKENLL